MNDKDSGIVDDMFAMPMNSALHPATVDYEILRVPGGWIYTKFPNLSSCFVPIPSKDIREGGLI